jgi:hypothetical protein
MLVQHGGQPAQRIGAFRLTQGMGNVEQLQDKVVVRPAPPILRREPRGRIN